MEDLRWTEVDNEDGSHTVSIETEVASPVTPGLLRVQIEAGGIRNADIDRPIGGVSTMQLRNVIRTSNSYSAELSAPYGRYNINVLTNSAVPITLSARF